jgi:hypothetical protein
MSFQGEMTGGVEVDLCLRVVAPERLGSCRYKKWIVLAPNRQQRWRMLSEVSLELWIESDIARIVEKQIELRLKGSRPRQIVVIQRAPIRRYDRRIRNPLGVLNRNFRFVSPISTYPVDQTTSFGKSLPFSANGGPSGADRALILCKNMFLRPQTQVEQCVVILFGGIVAVAGEP